MNLARHSITPTSPVLIADTRLDADNALFTTCTPAGFAVYQAWPLKLLRKREFSNGTLSSATPMHVSSLIFLLGGGRSPLYPPNKVILWDDAQGKEVAELEFRERVRGLACRRGWLAVALRRRVVVFEINESISRHAEWDTSDNVRGLLAIATGTHATLLAFPGKQMGHVQLVHLPPCPPPVPLGPPTSGVLTSPPSPTKHPVSIIVAHTTPLTTLSVPPSGRLLATTSESGTLIRVWDTQTGKLVRELRRGTDRANMYGVAFRADEEEMCVWSDKGTIHIFSLRSGTNRQSTLSPLTPFIPLPKYFDSEWSYAQYRIPTQSAHLALSSNIPRTDSDTVEEERCVVGWISVPVSDDTTADQDSSAPPSPLPTSYAHQLIALTFTGGWYRLSLPVRAGSSSAPAPTAAVPHAAQMSSSPPKGPLASVRARSVSGRSVARRSETGRDRDREREKREKEKDGRECVLEEFRRYGRWDGWG